MFRIRTIAVTGLAALALAALGASAPGASAKMPCKAPVECYGLLTNERIIPIPPQPEPEPIIDIVSRGAVEFTGGTLVVNCPQGQLTGSIHSTDGGLQAPITGASFGGGGGAPCGSSLGPAVVAAGPQPLPWKQVLKPNGKAQLTGPISLTLSMDEAGMTCFYSTKSIKSTYNTDEEPIDLELPKPPKFKVQEGSSPACPKKLTLSSGAWDVKASTPAGGELPVVFIG
jgi:hypothetical protein